MVLAAIAALAAESVSRITLAAGSATAGVPSDLDGLLTPSRAAVVPPVATVRVATDPLGNRQPVIAPGTVAPRGGVPTVISSVRRGRRLTAILIADGRSVAVIDDAVVSVGDRLPDGARIEEIRS
ncbi:MAG TPA: hypothetical protein VF483_08770, partial [Gemmatimonadaceae bacterium]